MCNFTIGRIVLHQKFGYRGVIVGVDETFKGSDEWYEKVARSCPPRENPWYHVLVDGAAHRTYVAERHLQPDQSGEPIQHPELEEFFDLFRHGSYGNSIWN